jgi:hypothetical protein
MRTVIRAICLVVLSGTAVQPVTAADVSRLEWGAFIVEDDSSNGYQEIISTTSDDGRTLSLTFSALEAKADGSTLEAKAGVTGHYDISQPKLDTYALARLKLEGHIIKSSGAKAKLLIKLGSTEQTVEWPEGSVASGKYSRSIDMALPAEGRLPSPFLVSVEAIAQKTGFADAVYVSVGSLTIAALEEPKVAAK